MKNSLKYLFSNIRNNQGAYRKSFKYQNINFCTDVLKILVKNGFLRGFKKNKNSIEILLKYYKDYPVILDILNGRPSYISYLSLCKIKNTNKLIILSTSKGLLTYKEAINFRVGGFLICKVM